MCQALRFVVGPHALSFGWEEPYEAIADRDERLQDVPAGELAFARAVPPDGDVAAPPDAWEIVVDHAPAGMGPQAIARRCRHAFAAIRPVLRLLMRGPAGSVTGGGSGCR